MTEPTHPKPTCPHCGSDQLVHGLHLRQRNALTEIGLTYDQGVLFCGFEPLSVDLCQKCGTVLRFYVQHPQREWD